jgi:hypothetical protein
MKKKKICSTLHSLTPLARTRAHFVKNALSINKSDVLLFCAQRRKKQRNMAQKKYWQISASTSF